LFADADRARISGCGAPVDDWPVRLTPITRADGLVLARDLPVVGGSALPLLRAGAQLTPRLIEVLDAKGFKAVYVEDELSLGVEPVDLLPEDVRSEAAARVAGALRSARDAFASQQTLRPGLMADLSAAAGRIAEHLLDSPDAAMALADLAGAHEYTHRHSVNVTALGLLLAREHWRRHGWRDHTGRARYDRVEEQLTKLGIGLLLHDVGKMAVPVEVLDKPGALDEEEWVIVRSHPQAGYDLLDSPTLSPLARSVVRDHHERFDGSGYPRGLVGTAIHEFSRIAAIADVYDAVCSERPYRGAEPPSVGVAIITRGSGTAFDPALVDTFRRLVFPYPVGSEMWFPDGRLGVVCSVDPDRPEAPLVRVPDGAGGVEEIAWEPGELVAA
jgi:HD-GYP domain-containing protein (c-di-GMP phosphodiesterase class II)